VPKSEQIHIQKHVSLEELNKKIRSERDGRILKRLYFVKYRYEGESIAVSSQRVGITRSVGYLWQERWNTNGYDGLIPRYWGVGRPSRLSDHQKDELKDLLHQKDNWTAKEVGDLILRTFDVEYTLKQVRVILHKFGMKYAKTYPYDHRRPNDSEENLKNTAICGQERHNWIF